VEKRNLKNVIWGKGSIDSASEAVDDDVTPSCKMIGDLGKDDG
jgi:hypothetical protein